MWTFFWMKFSKLKELCQKAIYNRREALWWRPDNNWVVDWLEANRSALKLWPDWFIGQEIDIVSARIMYTIRWNMFSQQGSLTTGIMWWNLEVSATGRATLSCISRNSDTYWIAYLQLSRIYVIREQKWYYKPHSLVKNTYLRRQTSGTMRHNNSRFGDRKTYVENFSELRSF